ncbi:O-antigen ligase family protein [Segnochrobactrum spirostomi]|uniref:O-antigen ligase family protein n=1 Tax=Segnochrobactrum spirostomi TaxID=2608987 RepID=A0A6A7Y5U9_9HYPH|nr:O-antigen ligase family protein [Segnochrobactrum spirostomi]MQT13461.1 O-antigen ligase family protein [Segnochrobactrum spirostomi]
MIRGGERPNPARPSPSIATAVRPAVAPAHAVQLAVFFTFVAAGGMPWVDRSGDYAAFEAGPRFALFYAGCALAAGLAALAAPARMAALVPLPLVLLVGWCGLTIAASPVPETALRTLAATVAAMGACAALVAGAPAPSRLFRGMLAILLLLLAADYATVILRPDLGIHAASDGLEPNNAGAWRGFHLHKNNAGMLSVAGVLLVLGLFGRSRPVAALAIAAPFAAFAVLSVAKTAMIAAAVALLVAPAVVGPWSPTRRAVLVCGALAALAVAIMFVDDELRGPLLLALFGDETLTGRLPIWRFLLGFAADHPWFGGGYASLWEIGDAAPARSAPDVFLHRVANAHSAYLDVLASLGVPGLAFTLVAFVAVPAARLARVRFSAEDRPALIVATSLWLFGLVAGLTTPVFLQKIRIEWIVFLTGYFALLRMTGPGVVRPGDDAGAPP